MILTHVLLVVYGGETRIFCHGEGCLTCYLEREKEVENNVDEVEEEEEDEEKKKEEDSRKWALEGLK